MLIRASSESSQSDATEAATRPQQAHVRHSIHDPRLRINLCHPFVRKMFIDKFCDRIWRLDSVLPLRVAPERHRRDQDISRHQNDQNPGQRRADLLRDLLDPVRQKWIRPFHPEHRDDPPEKAIQQIDPAAQIERDLAVIPEHRPEHILREYAAHIFVCTAHDRPVQENETVVAIPIAVQKSSQKRTRDAPDNAERPVDHAAAAHPRPQRKPAEHRLHDIAEERSNQKQPDLLVKTAALSKSGLLLRLLLRLRLQDLLRLNVRVGALQPAQHRPRDHVSERRGHFMHVVGDARHAVDIAAPLKDDRQRPQDIDRQEPEQDIQNDSAEAVRNQTQQPKQKRVTDPQHKKRPCSEIKQQRRRDKPVKSDWEPLIAPPFPVEDARQDQSGQNHQTRTDHDRAQNQKQRPVFELT